MLRAQLEADIEQAEERIRKTSEGDFDPAYKASEIKLQQEHIAHMKDELLGLEKYK
jgi:hypothetical protein